MRQPPPFDEFDDDEFNDEPNGYGPTKEVQEEFEKAVAYSRRHRKAASILKPGDLDESEDSERSYDREEAVENIYAKAKHMRKQMRGEKRRFHSNAFLNAIAWVIYAPIAIVVLVVLTCIKMLRVTAKLLWLVISKTFRILLTIFHFVVRR